MGAPGSDGITNYLYYKLFNCLGDHLTEVITTIFKNDIPTLSQRTCLMIFASKPGKTESILLKDKRKISLLNSDFKILTGIENSRHNKILNRTVSHLQYALGTDKKIHHAISLARDAIYTSSLKKGGFAICDLDFKSAFDLLGMNWVFKVLECKGLNTNNVNRLRRYYTDSSTIPIINNI